MLYTLTEDEYNALSPKAEAERRDSALTVARRMILEAAGRKCIHDPDWKGAFRYCSGCPLDPLENSGRPHNHERYELFKLICGQQTAYGK